MMFGVPHGSEYTSGFPYLMLHIFICPVIFLNSAFLYLNIDLSTQYFHCIFLTEGHPLYL